MSLLAEVQLKAIHVGQTECLVSFYLEVWLSSSGVVQGGEGDSLPNVGISHQHGGLSMDANV